MNEKQPNDPCWDCYKNVKICTASMSGTPSAMAGPIYELAPVGTLERIRKAESLLSAICSVIEKHKEGVDEPYLVPGGAAEVLKLFYRDIERILEN